MTVIRITPSSIVLPVENCQTCLQAGTLNSPAKKPTAWYPLVVELISPDIGGPISAPMERILIHMPSRRPISLGSPIAIKGLGSKDI